MQQLKKDKKPKESFLSTPVAPSDCVIAGADALPTSRFLDCCAVRRLLDLLTSRFLRRKPRFEPRLTLAVSSVTVAPVNGGDVEEGSFLACEGVLEGTFNRGPVFCAFSDTAGPGVASLSFADGGDGTSVLDASGADSDVSVEEGRLSGKGSTFNKWVQVERPLSDVASMRSRTRRRRDRRGNGRSLVSSLLTKFFTEGRSAH